MWKIDIEHDGRWVERDGAYRFARQATPGGSRLRFALPRSLPTLVHELCRVLAEPVQLLYVLHTSRGGSPLGRYQSPELDRAQLDGFLARFSDFLVGDARHDLWIRSAASGTFIVWDRHNDVHVYGEAGGMQDRLVAAGFEQGDLDPLGDHRHCYRGEFDADARAVLEAFAWRRTPLKLEDEQYVAPVANDDARP